MKKTLFTSKLSQKEWEKAYHKGYDTALKANNKRRLGMFDSMKDNPEEIIAWCKGEIEAYQQLIKLVSKLKS